MTWLILIVRLTGEASRHRVAVWRELRKVGAAPVSQGVWTVPDTPFFAEAVQKVVQLAGRGSGDVLVLSSSAGNGPGEEALHSAFEKLRVDEWSEFENDCGKFGEEIAKEIRIEKFTLAELEEEEQSLERLRRWYRDLKSRDVLDLPAARQAERRLGDCAQALEGYAEKVYGVLHAKAGSSDDPAKLPEQG